MSWLRCCLCFTFMQNSIDIPKETLRSWQTMKLLLRESNLALMLSPHIWGSWVKTTCTPVSLDFLGQFVLIRGCFQRSRQLQNFSSPSAPTMRMTPELLFSIRPWTCLQSIYYNGQLLYKQKALFNHMKMTFIAREGVAIPDTMIYANVWNLLTKCGFTALWGLVPLTWRANMQKEDDIKKNMLLWTQNYCK